MAFYFINELKNIKGHILIKITQLIDLDGILAEDPAVVSKRKFHMGILKILEKSEKIMSSDEE